MSSNYMLLPLKIKNLILVKMMKMKKKRKKN